MSGMRMSMSTRSGRCATAAATPSTPPSASNVRKPANRSTSRASFRFCALSSTIRISSSAIALHPALGRQCEPEGAAGAERALDPQAPAVQLDELARKRQAETRTVGASRMPLLELFEDHVEVLG